MASQRMFLFLITHLLLSISPSSVCAQNATPTSSYIPGTTSATITSAPPTSFTGSSVSSTTSSSDSSVTTGNSTYPDVLLSVPQLSVGRIELDVDNLSADINLNANVASLVSINAGVQVSVQKVNITIANVDAELELVVRLGNLVDIVQRVFQSLDLNPLLITALSDVTAVVDTVVGAVDGLLGSITQGGTTLNFLVDNLGNIVQQVVSTAGTAVDTIVGNYLSNMTYTGVSTALSGGETKKVYSYSPLNALVDIVFNSVGQIVQATVEKTTATSTAASTTATLVVPATSATLTLTGTGT